MTISDFDKRVLIEQLRYIETEDSLVDDVDILATDVVGHGEFAARLWQRAERLIVHNELMPALRRATKRSRIAKGVALSVAVVLGALATNFAVSADTTINIYWLLLVLLGFNLLSMLLWLVGISFKLDGLVAGVLAQLTSWVPGQFKEKSQASAAADRAWLACNFGGRVGKWQFSTITHQLWLAYLLSGLAVLLLALMARQYDFVWGTTLLSDSAFVSLTELLGRPLQVLGLTTPTAEQVQQTRIGAELPLTVTQRNSWAQFLLGALLMFGVLPRFLLWCWAMAMRTVARRDFALDDYLPYYISLRQQLLPLAGHGEIVDADAFPPAAPEMAAINSATHSVPIDAQWVAVELGEEIDWPPAFVGKDKNLGLVKDRQSLADIVQRLEKQPGEVVAVAVLAARAPDRGVQRAITSLFATGTQPWLVLLQDEKHDTISATRLEAWYRLAQACAVPADHVVSMSVA